MILACRIVSLEIEALLEVLCGERIERAAVELERLRKPEVGEHLPVGVENLGRGRSERRLVDDPDGRSFHALLLFKPGPDGAFAPGEEILLVRARRVVNDLGALKSSEAVGILAPRQIGGVSDRRRHEQAASNPQWMQWNRSPALLQGQ